MFLGEDIDNAWYVGGIGVAILPGSEALEIIVVVENARGASTYGKSK